MGMFDRYEPASTPNCHRCGEPMTLCQGKDGPNILATWTEGRARMTIGQRVDEPADRLEEIGLPKRFAFSCWGPNDHRRDFVGECVDGVWVRTVPSSALGGHSMVDASELS